MAGIDRDAQVKNENAVKDFIIKAGSPIIAQSIHKREDIPWHTAHDILERFEDAQLVEKVKVPWGTGSAFVPTPELKKINLELVEWERVGKGWKIIKREDKN